MDARAQVAAKQRILEDNLKHIGKVEPELILPAIYGAAWGYRYRARLVRALCREKECSAGGLSRKAQQFRRRHAIVRNNACANFRAHHAIAEIGRQPVHPERLPQIEVSLGEDVDVLVLRILEPLNTQDEAMLKVFADQHRIQFFLQPGGPEDSLSVLPARSPPN